MIKTGSLIHRLDRIERRDIHSPCSINAPSRTNPAALSEAKGLRSFALLKMTKALFKVVHNLKGGVGFGSLRYLILPCSLFLLPLFVGLQAWADVSVQATVDRNQVEQGGTFTLKVSVNSDQRVPSNPPRLPVISNVQLLHQWSSSQSRSSVVSTGQGIDFKTIKSKIYNYQYTTLKQGVVRIDAIGVQVQGQSYETKPIQIQVLKPGAAPSFQARQGRNQRPQGRQNLPKDPFEEMEDRFNQLLNQRFGGVPGAGSFMTEPPTGKDVFFILAEVDKTEAYKGEQIVASWYLYTRGRVRDIDTLKYPTLKGFWKEDIQISTQLNFEQDVINGIPYSRALLASYALFPIQAGKQTIDPYKAKATIVGGFGFGRGQQATKASKNIPVLIKPLPEEGKPAAFTGAVGQFQMTVEAPTQPLVTHQPFPLRIRFEGRGNAKLIELPDLGLGDNLEIYDIKNESKFFKNGQSFKEFEVLLIPNEPGPLVIEALRTAYFDPQKKEYAELVSQKLELKVLPGTKQQSMGEERLKSNQEKKVLPGVLKSWDPSSSYRSSKFPYGLLLFPIALLVLLGKLIVDLGWLSRKPSLEEQVTHRFRSIDQWLAKKEVRKLGIECTNIVYLVLGELSGEGGANEELDKVLSKTAPSVRREIETPLRKLMDYFGVLGFGPESYVNDFKDFAGLKNKVDELRALLLKACQLSKGNSSVGN